MVLLILLSGVFFGTSKVLSERINSNLSEDELELIEQIEELEIEMIKKGLNPETLTIEQVEEYLLEQSHSSKTQSLKKKRYSEFLKKIKEHSSQLKR